jgi:hypothetical protein
LPLRPITIRCAAIPFSTTHHPTGFEPCRSWS